MQFSQVQLLPPYISSAILYSTYQLPQHVCLSSQRDKRPFWHSNMANSSSFLGEDRGGREEWNELLSGLKRFTCARASPAKSCCYLLPVHSDLSETRCAVSLGATAGPPTEWTPWQRSQRNKGTAKTPFQPRNESPREEAHRWELWEACMDTIHIDKERKKGEKKHQKQNPTITEQFSLW